MQVGKSGKGKIVHAVVITPKFNHAACDKRQQGLTIDSVDVTTITCAKCLLRTEVKKALLGKKESKPAVDNVPPRDKDSVGLPTAPAAKKKAKPKLDVTSKKTTSKKKTTTTTTTAAKEEIISDDGDFFAKAKKDGRFEIYHKPTEKRFFDSVPEEVVLDAIIKMNAIEVRWAKESDQMPKDFISLCRQALRDAYSGNNKTIPKSLAEVDKPKKKAAAKKVPPKSKTVKFKKGDRITSEVDGKEVEMEYNGKTFVLVQVGEVKPAEKPKKKISRRKKPEEKPVKRTIKRRAEKQEESKRTIKRRSKEDTLLGRTKGTPGFTVVEMLLAGSTMLELVAKLTNKHKMDPKKAWTKIRAVIRKTARKQSIPVVIVMQDADPGNDYYIIETKKK